MIGFLVWCAAGALGFLVLFFLQKFTKIGYSSELWEADASRGKIARCIVFYVLCGPIVWVMVIFDLLGLWLD